MSAHAPDSKTLTRNALERLNRAQGTRGADGGVDLEDRIRAWSSSTTAQLSLDSVSFALDDVHVVLLPCTSAPDALS